MPSDVAVVERSRVPDQVIDLVCSEAASVVGRPDLVLELWSDLGEMLPRALATLGAEQGLALRSAPQAIGPQQLEPVQSESKIRYGLMADGPVPAQVVVGVLPWRWAPQPARVQTPDGDVDLVDDPACVALLRACWLMPRPGVAGVVVGPGFFARRGPDSVAANLSRLGLRVINVHTLDRGAFRPAAARGRLLLVLGHNP